MSLRRLCAAPGRLSVCCWLLLVTGTLGVKVFVKEGSDASLPCSLTEDVTAALFDWRKVAHGDQQQKEVFFHQAASHYNNGLRGQNEEFKGRVSFFEDELKHGNASIVIRNAKMADDGNYTCAFPLLQTPQIFYVELVVDLPFKDRSAESSVATPEPFVRALDAGGDRSLLHCEVRGASPEPKVEWQDGHGNPLPAEAQVSETGSGYDVTVNVTVNKTDLYRCVVEQEAIKHRIAAETFVHICEKACEDSSSKVSVGWSALTFAFGVFSVLAVQTLLVFGKCVTIRRNTSHRQQENDLEIQGTGLKIQGTGLKIQGTGLKIQGTGLKNSLGNQGTGLGNGLEHQGTGLGNQGTGLGNGLEHQGTGLGNQGTDLGNGLEHQGTGLEHQGTGLGNGLEHKGTGLEHQGTGLEHQGTGLEHQGTGLEHKRNGVIYKKLNGSDTQDDGSVVVDS
ncbi:uncharacterized protein LOC117730613 [Cyclopterus lumpus]|uniref:uncharacterized protein LOC117730613 n=1 Tax=Cyclopterus lumpus TaxID=8103 RepID=UPI00148699F6|nr:uncharacterized protein LOC117730613 [Cyclopterus lumpus]